MNSADLRYWGVAGSAYLLQQFVPALAPAAWVSLALLAGGACMLVIGLRAQRDPTMAGVLIGAGGGAVLLALYLFWTFGPQPFASQGDVHANPIDPTQQSLATGKQLYTQYCMECHGVTGKGDGPRAGSLPVPPINLTEHVGFHADAQLYEFISSGDPASGMPPFADQLTSEQIWHIVNYVKTLEAMPAASPTPHGSH